MKNHFLITFSRVAELGGKVVYSVPPSREFRAQTVLVIGSNWATCLSSVLEWAPNFNLESLQALS